MLHRILATVADLFFYAIKCGLSFDACGNCKVCGRYRANEKFTGKGHATHICKDCAKLPPEVKAEQETLNRLSNLPWYLSKAQKDWLKNRTKDRRPEVKALAQEQYDMRFGRRHQEMQLDDSAEFDEDEFEEME